MEALVKDYEIREYDPQFKEQMLDLQRYHWGPDKERNIAYFEWKYEKNPYIATPIILVALKNSRVIGMLGMFGTKWEFGQDRKSMICPGAADLVVHPAHRRRGLFKTLMCAQFEELVARGFRYTLGLSAGASSYPGFLSTGWKSIGPLETRRRRQRDLVRKAVQMMRNTFGRPSKVQVFSFLDRCIGQNEIFIESSPRTQQMAELVKRLGHDGRIRHVRDGDYFTWRFQNPFSQYRFLFKGKERLDGYLALQASYDVNTRSRTTIVDMEASTDEIAAELLRTAVKWGRFENLFVWSKMLSGNIKNLFIDLNFKPVVSETGDCPVIVRPLDDPHQEENWRLGAYSLLSSSSWDLRWLYSDHCG